MKDRGEVLLKLLKDNPGFSDLIKQQVVSLNKFILTDWNEKIVEELIAKNKKKVRF